MRVAFHHIAYQPLAVCNALSMDRLEAMARRAGLKPNAAVMDIGCAYGEVSIHVARAFDVHVAAMTGSSSTAATRASKARARRIETSP